MLTRRVPLCGVLYAKVERNHDPCKISKKSAFSESILKQDKALVSSSGNAGRKGLNSKASAVIYLVSLPVRFTFFGVISVRSNPKAPFFKSLRCQLWRHAMSNYENRRIIKMNKPDRIYEMRIGRTTYIVSNYYVGGAHIGERIGNLIRNAAEEISATDVDISVDVSDGSRYSVACADASRKGKT